MRRALIPLTALALAAGCAPASMAPQPQQAPPASSSAATPASAESADTPVEPAGPACLAEAEALLLPAYEGLRASAAVSRARSDTHIFASEEFASLNTPRSCSSEICVTMPSEATRLPAMRASFSWISWKPASLRPNCSRSRT